MSRKQQNFVVVIKFNKKIEYNNASQTFLGWTKPRTKLFPENFVILTFFLQFAPSPAQPSHPPELCVQNVDHTKCIL